MGQKENERGEAVNHPTITPPRSVVKCLCLYGPQKNPPRASIGPLQAHDRPRMVLDHVPAHFRASSPPFLGWSL